MSKLLRIRNSTAEFLIFQAEDKAEGVQVFYQDENIWATQEVIATLFDKGRSTITEHLRNIFDSGELDQNSVCRKFRLTTQHGAIEGKTQTKEVTFYDLDAIISVGYRVYSVRATQFRRWTIAGSVSHEQAKEFAETEFEKYRVIQDRLFESDFDRFALPTLPFEDAEKK